MESDTSIENKDIKRAMQIAAAAAVPSDLTNTANVGQTPHPRLF